MKPYKAIPMLKERIWGGQRLKQYNKNFENARIGESWETDKDSMPALIKLIDANDILSVQVHPNDELALKLENQKNGKTEAWIVLECDEGAELVAGIKQGTNRQQFEAAIAEGCIEKVLNITKVKKGDCIYIPAGTVHSLGRGMMVYEVQQPSDLTYRLHDWNRMDEAGSPRALHIHKALQSIDFDVSEVRIRNLYEEAEYSSQKYVVFDTQYFKTYYLRLGASFKYDVQSRCFTALTMIAGSGYIDFEENQVLIFKGETWIIPEGSIVTLRAINSAEFIITEAY